MNAAPDASARRAFTVLVLTLLAAPVLAQDEGTDAWTPETSMRFHAITETALSPDGSMVAYVVRDAVTEGEKSEYVSQIWMMPADGSWHVQYTQGEKSSSSPAFSPDGTLLAFTSARSGENQVWVMRVQGGEAWQLTDAETGVSGFVWSPDGERIAYTMTDPKTAEQEQREKEKRDVIHVDQNFRYNHLYTVALAENDEGGHDVQRLTSGHFQVTSFDWSPDGKTIVFAHQPDPRINSGFTTSDLAVVPSDSGAVTQLVTWAGADTSPYFSPDGQWVAFVGQDGAPEAVGLGDVFVVPAAGGDPRRLAETPDRNANLLAWTGDGSAVYVAETIGTTRHLLRVPLEGDDVTQVTEGAGVVGPVAFDADRAHVAFTFQDLDTPSEVFLSSTDHFAMQKLTTLNEKVDRPPMGRTELISWTSPDGTPIEGLLTYPIGYEEGQRVPLILNVHGGPAGAFSQAFSGLPSVYMVQYFAQHGYAIIRPNPRGSTGYGKDFRYANVRDWGYGDYEDLMAGVDKVIDMGVGHPDSLAVMGWSYGGYMTSFVVTRTDRFKAASMGAGLPDLISMVTTTDIPDYLVAHMGAEFWEDYDVYEKHSAIFHIANVKTPTQIIHGQNDFRVPTTQGQEFYVALERMGIPTEMLLLPRTPHGPREPKLLMAVSPEILRWFEHHVRGRDVPMGAPAMSEEE